MRMVHTSHQPLSDPHPKLWVFQVEGHFKAFALPDNVHTGMGVSFLEAYSNHTSQVRPSII